MLGVEFSAARVTRSRRRCGSRMGRAPADVPAPPATRLRSKVVHVAEVGGGRAPTTREAQASAQNAAVCTRASDPSGDANRFRCSGMGPCALRAPLAWGAFRQRSTC